MKTRRIPGIKVLAGTLVAASVLAGCAAPADPNDPDSVAEFQAVNDPAEPLNRGIFEFNRVLDTMVLKPAATFYRAFLPPPVQDGIHNFLDNLRSPIVFLNDVLQGDMDRAGTTVARFVINTTYGVLGFADQATDMGYEYHNEDFGQTLAVWGLPEGPFVMLPVFGPSNPRDTVGMVVDFLVDPVNLWANNSDREGLVWGRAILKGVDTRARHYDALEDLEKSSLDYYASIRSLYRQRRADEIRNGEVSTDLPGPGISTAPAQETPEEEAQKNR